MKQKCNKFAIPNINIQIRIMGNPKISKEENKQHKNEVLRIMTGKTLMDKNMNEGYNTKVKGNTSNINYIITAKTLWPCKT